jgi:hypothetical protein
LLVLERASVASYFVFWRNLVYAMIKVSFTSTGSTEGKTLPKYVHIFIMNDINLTLFFSCQFWHQFQVEKKDYSLKQILESVANAKQHAYRSLSTI